MTDLNCKALTKGGNNCEEKGNPKYNGFCYTHYLQFIDDKQYQNKLKLCNDLIFNIFNYLGYNEADKLIEVSKLFSDLVKQYKWNDVITPLKYEYDLKTWREKYPNAIGVNTTKLKRITDKDCKYLRSIKYLDIS